jgi:hypothetical protein
MSHADSINQGTVDVRTEDAFGAFSCVTDNEQEAVREVSEL